MTIVNVRIRKPRRRDYLGYKFVFPFIECLYVYPVGQQTRMRYTYKSGIPDNMNIAEWISTYE